MPVSFANDVRPLFRPDDVDCMSGLSVKLDDYAYMASATGNEAFPDHANAYEVLARLKGTRKPRMPAGGPFWPAAQIELLEQWMGDGFLA